MEHFDMNFIPRLRIVFAYFVLFLVFTISASSASADTFVPSSDTLRTTAASGATTTFTVVVTDLTSHSIIVGATLHATNSSLWHLGDSHITIGADTTHTGHFEVSFSASASGTYVASVELYDSVGGTQKTVTLIVTVAAAPTNLHLAVDGNFLGTAVGTTVCKSVYIYFPGDSSNVTLTAISLLHSSSIWSVSLDSVALPYLLEATHTGLVTVCFSPANAGDATDTLEVTYTDADDSSRVAYAAVVGSASVPPPTEQLHAFLSGSFAGTHVDSTVCHPVLFYAAIDSGSTITISSVTLATASSVWSLNTNGFSFPLTRTHGVLDTLIVCFDPNAVGDFRDSLQFNYTDSHDSSRVVYVALVGSGVEPHDCFRIDGDTSSAYGPTIAGTSTDRSLAIVNGTSQTWIITSVDASCDTDVWDLSGLSFPDTILSGNGSHFRIVFHAPSVTSTERYACTFQFHGHCATSDCEQGLNVRGYSSPDTSKISLVPDTTQTIAFAASQPGSTYKIVQVKNNSGHRIKVEGISLSSTANFGVTLVYPDSSLPFYLSGDGSFWVKLSLNDSAAGTYNDTLLITTEFGATALTVPIQAFVHESTAGVPTVPISMERAVIQVYPNPSHGEVVVALNGMTHATVQVLNLLGQVVWQVRDAANSVRLLGSTGTGLLAHSGTYIVRATGTLPSGHTGIASTRVSIER